MKRILAFVLCLVLLAASAFAEDTDAYGVIQMEDTLETVSQKLEKRGETEDGYADFGGVLCAFFESGRLRAKIRAFDDVRDVAARADGDFEAAKKLKKGALLESVTSLMGGEGAEIMRINLSDEETSGVQIVLAWVNSASTVMEALFELDDGEWTLFAVVEITEG